MWIDEEEEHRLQESEERMRRERAEIRRRWPTRETYEQARSDVGQMLMAALPYYEGDDYDPVDVSLDIDRVMGAAAESGDSAEAEAQVFIVAALRAWARQNPTGRH